MREKILPPFMVLAAAPCERPENVSHLFTYHIINPDG